MIIKSKDTKIKKIGVMNINEYKINSEYSGALIKINGKHGKMKSLNEDRIYFVIEGDGKFIINDKESEVGVNDMIVVPKNTPYDIIGKMKYLLICSPEFNPINDKNLE